MVMMTLFCDASFCGGTRAAGWGAWAKCDGWEHGQTFGGPLPIVNNASCAELHAIKCALTRLADANYLDRVASVMVQSDSTRALGAIIYGLPNVRNKPHSTSAHIGNIRFLEPDEQKAIRVIHGLLARKRVIVRHVRGHKPGDKRQWVNRQCDAIAKEHMRNQRLKLR